MEPYIQTCLQKTPLPLLFYYIKLDYNWIWQKYFNNVQ